MKVKCVPTEYTVLVDGCPKYRIVRIETDGKEYAIARDRSLIMSGCYSSKEEALNEIKYAIENNCEENL